MDELAALSSGRRASIFLRDLMMLRLKRIYEAPAKGDGFRILVERLWPRGIQKEQARVDLWLKEIAPRPGLRRWFGHDPQKWEEFRRRYWSELREKEDLLPPIREKSRKGLVTLVFAARDRQHSGALALKEFLERGG